MFWGVFQTIKVNGVQNQTPWLSWTKISSLVFHRRKKVIHFGRTMRVSEVNHFWVDYPFNFHLHINFIVPGTSFPRMHTCWSCKIPLPLIPNQITVLLPVCFGLPIQIPMLTLEQSPNSGNKMFFVVVYRTQVHPGWVRWVKPDRHLLYEIRTAIISLLYGPVSLQTSPEKLSCSEPFPLQTHIFSSIKWCYNDGHGFDNGDDIFLPQWLLVPPFWQDSSYYKYSPFPSLWFTDIALSEDEA